MKSKILLIVCDGMGDRLTNGRTPLEAAKKPNMDKISAGGINGIMDTVGVGIRPGSDTSHLSLFGYNPFEVYTGRGPFEAAGAGIEMKVGDVALRCNFGTISDGKIVDRRAGREDYGLDELSKEIDGMKIKNTEIIFKRCKGHRAVLVLHGKNLSHCVSDTDPEELEISYKKSIPLDKKADSKKTAEILNIFTEKTVQILSDHKINKERIKHGKLPANIILARGAGIMPELQSFEERYGLKAACISATSLIKGVCRTLGMDVIEVSGATGHIDSDIGAKADAAINAIKNYDFVFLHIKGADEASHDGNFDSKKRMIERIDNEVIGKVLQNSGDITIALTADHSTPVNLKEHSADPTPIAILGDVRTDSVKEFTERNCAHGGLGRICGRDLMNILLDISNRARLFGA